MLEASGITVRFRGVLALDSVDLTLSEGEILGLIGPNGSGKTTLLNVLSGFVKPSSGRVHLEQRDITESPPRTISKLGIGRTFQSVRLFKRLTVNENILLGFLGAGLSRRRARIRSRQLLEQLSLVGEAEDAAAALPYGAQRRVALARTLATEPRYLLLDEPAAGLNDAESEEFTNVLRGVQAERGFGVMVIEHDMKLIMGLCHRIHVLDAGKTLASGTPEAIRSDPSVVEAYLGAPRESV